jgi:2-dehydro-3-deoxy-D-gluconate 5-dehydrogenase
MSIDKLVDLTGKTALVTGCKRGIGKAMAIALAEAGAVSSAFLLRLSQQEVM